MSVGTSLTTQDAILIKWLIVNQGWTLPSPDATYTHLSMDGHRGGKLYIRANQESEFLEKYWDSIENGEKLFLTEMRTDVFRFFVDVDLGFGPDKIFTEEQRSQFCSSVVDTVKLFYPSKPNPEKDTVMFPDERDEGSGSGSDSRFMMVICDTSDRRKPLTGANMHLIFPNLFVRQEQAIAISSGIRSKLGLLALSFLDKSIEDVIDPAVYTSNGLRMVGSRKAQKCGVCTAKKADKKRQNCQNCCGAGKVDLGKVYRIREVFDNVEATNRILQNGFEAIRHVSIRIHDVSPTSGWEPYEGCPPYLDKKTTDRKGKGRIKNSKSIESADPVHQACQTIVRASHPKYKDLVVKSVELKPNGREYFVRVFGDNVNFCHNRAGGYHTSSSIYFVITHGGLFQRCFSTKTSLTDRTDGVACKQFKKKFIPQKNHLVVLFPELVPYKVPTVSVEVDSGQSAFGKDLLRVIARNIEALYQQVYVEKNDAGKKKKRRRSEYE